MKPDKHVTVLPETVAKAIESCPTGKAGGPDCILYEHLKTAKEFMSIVLANVFTQMFRTGYIPDRMKCGTIITLHKGGKTRTDDPNNYRAIPLTSVSLKLFETVIFERSTHTILANLSPQQGGFQQNLGCILYPTREYIVCCGIFVTALRMLSRL